MYIYNGIDLGNVAGVTASSGKFLGYKTTNTTLPRTDWLNTHIYSTTIADATANGGDTYLLGVDATSLKASSIITFRGCVTKTAAGTATPIFNVRFGTAGTIGDTARHTFTCVAQTAAADTGLFEIKVVVRSLSTTATSHGMLRFEHFNTTTGLANKAQVQLIQNTSGTYNNTLNNLIVGLSVNPGASGVWTFQQVIATIENLNY